MTDIDSAVKVVEERNGDLFDAPDNAVLIHACNCVGSWGKGIAKAFREKYPAAYRAHHNYCKAISNEAIIGTCQLIPPQEEDYQKVARKRREVGKPGENRKPIQDAPGPRKHWIACVFTSIGYGKATKEHPGMDKPEVILENTRKALADLRRQLRELQDKDPTEAGEVKTDGKRKAIEEGEPPDKLYSCKFNSGLFAVKWADTREIVEEELKDLGKTVHVVSPVSAGN